MQNTVLYGDLTQSESGTIAVDLNGGQSTSDLLRVVGTAQLTGTILYKPVNFGKVAAGTYNRPVLFADNGVIDQGLKTASTSALIAFQTNVRFRNVSVTYTIDYALSFRAGSNQARIGQAFNAISVASDGAAFGSAGASFNRVAQALVASEDHAAVARVYDSLSGDSGAAVHQAMLSTGDAFADALTGSAREPFATGSDARTASFAVRYTGAASRFTSGAGGLSLDGGGTMVGVRQQIGDHAMFGTAYGADRSTFALTGRDAGGGLSGRHAAMFARWSAGSVYALANAQFDTVDTAMIRPVAGASTRFGARASGAGVEIGMRQALGGFTLTPSAGLRVTALSVDGHDEAAGNNALFAAQFDRADATSLRTRLSPDGEGMLGPIRSAFRVGWVREFDRARPMVLTFRNLPGATPIRLNGVEPAADALAINTGLTAPIGRAGLFARYSGMIGGVASDRRASLGLAVRW